MKKTRFAMGTVAMALALAGTVAQAETLTDFFNQSKIGGSLRSYYFSRDYGDPNVPNADAFSLGGLLNIQTAPFLGGFGVGVSFFTANSLGANSNQPGHTDVTLMGPGSSINALGQAYLQYQQPWLLVRAGDQSMNTPWLSDSDSRLLPATYQGVYTDVTPIKNLHFYGLREFRWKSHTSGNYYRDNLYYQPTFSGDSMYGGSYTGSLAANAPSTTGTLAFGASYALDGLKAQTWYYKFYQFANMFYGDASYTLKTGTGYNPFVGAQFVHEWGNNSLLNGVTLDTQTGNGVNSTAFGVKAGINSPFGQIMLGYNQIDPHSGAIGGGAIISPYTVGYATDPLYTTAMIRGLVEMGPGHAWKIKYTNRFFNKQILLIAAFAHFYTNYYGTSNYTYLDVTYFPKGMFKGLDIRDRIEVGNGGTLNPGNQSFVYNRVMLQYNF